MQDKAIRERAALSFIEVLIPASGLKFTIDVRDIFRWEAALIKKGIDYQMTDLRTGAVIASNDVLVPSEYKR